MTSVTTRSTINKERIWIYVSNIFIHTCSCLNDSNILFYSTASSISFLSNYLPLFNDTNSRAGESVRHDNARPRCPTKIGVRTLSWPESIFYPDHIFNNICDHNYYESKATSHTPSADQVRQCFYFYNSGNLFNILILQYLK